MNRKFSSSVLSIMIAILSITHHSIGQDMALTNYVKRQSVKPGTDGYMSIMSNTSVLVDKSDGLTIIYINGIKNGYNEGKISASEISGKLGRRVVHLYSTSIGFIADVKKAFDIKYGNLKSNDVIALYNLIIHEISRGQKVRVFAHSRGAAVTYRVVNMVMNNEYVNDKNDLNKVLTNLEVITLGGFAPVASKWPIGIKVYDLVNQYDLVGKYNDDVPFFDSYKILGVPIPKVTIKEHALTRYLNSLPNYKQFNLQIVWRTGI